VELEKIREIAERVALASGLEVTEIDFRGGGGKAGRMLRVFIERNAAGRRALQQSSEDAPLARLNADCLAGVTHDDCANFSREFSTILDVEDVVPGGAYTLEVSSPGLDRKLLKASDYQRFAGSRIKLMTREPVNGNRHFEGKLESFDGNRLVLDTASYKKKSKQQEAKKVDIEFANVEKANLVPEI
jgi:ribosome maturation factor RimP